MLQILFILAFGSSAAVLCIRLLMIDAGMVRDVLKADPNFKPTYSEPMNWDTAWDLEWRKRHTSAYRRHFPDGPLNAKLIQTRWALAVWVVLGLICLSLLSTGPR